MIKKNKIPYNSLNKESILSMITNYEKNNKSFKSENMLNKKSHRKRTRYSKENLRALSRDKKTSSFSRELYEDDHNLRTRQNYKQSLNALYTSNFACQRRKIESGDYLGLSNSNCLLK